MQKARLIRRVDAAITTTTEIKQASTAAPKETVFDWVEAFQRNQQLKARTAHATANRVLGKSSN